MQALRPTRWLAAALIPLVVAACADPEVAKREYLESGNRYLANGQLREAVVEYRNALNQDPKFGEARYQLGLTYEKNNDGQRAYREFLRAADLMPNNAEAQIKAGNYLLFSRQYEDAKARADKALAAEPKNVEAQLLRANSLAGLKDVAGAIAEVEEAIQEDPERAETYVNLGALQVAGGQAAEAEAAFRKAVDTSPNEVKPRLALGNYLLLTRRAQEAQEVLKQAHVIAPDDELVNRALASFYIVTGRAALAEPHLKKVAATSKDPRSQLMLADYYVASNRRDQAMPILETLASETNTYAKATLRLAQLEYAAGKRDAAERLVDQVLAKEANNGEALVAKARLRYAAGNYDGALESAREAVAADPRSAAAQLALARAHLARRDNPAAAAAFKEALRLNPRIAEAQLELARLELASGSAESSVELASRAVAAQPGNAEARLLLARGLMARGDLARAEQEMRLLESRFPDVGRVQAQMGILYAMKGDAAAARKAFDRALQIEPKLLDAVAGLVSLDLRARNTAGAVATIEKQLAAGSPGAGLLVLAGQTYAAASNPAKAEEMLRKAIATDSANFQAYATLGRLYLTQKRLDEARAEFDAITKKQPRSVGAHTMVATIFDYQNRKAEAKQRYEQILAIDPEAPVASNNLAWMLAEGGGNLDIALQLAQTATRKLPDNPDVSDTLGWVYYRKGLPSLSIPPFQKSVEKNPKNATYRYHLGLAYAKVGDVENARAELTQAVTLDPNSPQAQEAREALKTLPG